MINFKFTDSIITPNFILKPYNYYNFKGSAMAGYMFYIIKDVRITKIISKVFDIITKEMI